MSHGHFEFHDKCFRHKLRRGVSLVGSLYIEYGGKKRHSGPLVRRVPSILMYRLTKNDVDMLRMPHKLLPQLLCCHKPLPVRWPEA